MSRLDGGSGLRWLSASTMMQWHHFGLTYDPEPQNLSQVGWVYLYKAAMDAFGQHINVLKHLMYVLIRWGKQFEMAVSLNHDAMASFWFDM